MTPKHNSILKFICSLTNGDNVFRIIIGSTDNTVKLNLGSDSTNALRLRNNACYSVWSEKPIGQPDNRIIALIQL